MSISDTKNIDLSLLSLDFTALSKLISQGQISAAELFAQHQQAAVKLNPALNAFININTSKNSEGPNLTGALHGLALGVKDNIDVSDLPTTAGLEIRRHHLPDNDAFVISQLKQAGSAIVGKLNMHEGALGASNHNAHFGHCYNPHQLGYTPGGSSGGSGAAVAACIVPIALGTDTMGSVRIPASYCGVFGLKPSRGAVSNRGSVPCGKVLDSIGPLARSVRDLQLIYPYMVAYDAASISSERMVFTPYAPKKPVLLVPDDLQAFNVDASIISDFNANLAAWQDLGCEIRYFQLADFDTTKARRAGLLICEADMRIEYAAEWKNKRELFSNYLSALLSFIDTKSALDLTKAHDVVTLAKLQARSWLEQGDYLLLPTTLQRAFNMQDAIPANQADFTSIANFAGLPALSLPMLSSASTSSFQLPAGMQLVGKVGSDFELLDLAAKWQQLTDYNYNVNSAIKALYQ
ncbi:amidase [Rheinheimera salexigens]|uniref:amidase n=1 Tax=Rheinheimera salexigens TaxID=1628148 RepID=UPI001911F3C4|nr:amidase [Rheinheimera salexigens]